MGLFDHFPYTNFHELNLDWILSKFREFTEKVNLFSEKFEGGNKGQILVKKSNSDLDFEWDYINSIQNEKPHYLLLGDSYGDKLYGDKSWCKWFSTFMNLSNDEYENIAVAGSGFLDSRSEYQFITQLQNYTGDRKKVSHIILAGGLNDSDNRLLDNQYTALLNARIADFVAYAIANYPNAKLYIGYIGNGRDNSEYIGGRTLEYRRICKYFYEQYARFYGINILHNTEYCLSINTSYLDADGVHPSVTGATEIGRAISNIINGCGYSAYEYPYTTVFTPSTGISTDGLILRSISNNYMDIIIKNLTLSSAYELGTITAGTPVLIGTVSRIFANIPINIPIDIRLDFYNNLNYQIVKGVVTINNYNVTLTIVEMSDDGTTFKTFEPTSQQWSKIYVNGSGLDFTYTIDSDICA